MRIVSGFVMRQILGETVAIPSGESAHRLSGLIALNGSARTLFELLQTEQTEESLVQGLLEAFEVDRQTACADVAEFIDALRQNGLLIEND
jgi:hypothetical protein